MVVIVFNKILFISTLCALSNLTAAVYFPHGITATHVQKSHDVQVFWDIHHVLAKEDGGACLGAIMGNIFDIAWTKMTGDKVWKEINKLPKDQDISGEARYLIALKHGNHDLAECIRDAANAYVPRKGMEQLVRDIDAAGITQRLASNIGPRFLANLDAKFKKKKHQCKVFDSIKPGKIVDYSKYGNLPLPANINRMHLSPVTKSDPLFYDLLKSTYAQNKNSVFILIDDNLDNIKKAQSKGIIGIHFDFSKKKCVEKLREELMALGIFNHKK
jgi:hypothetical protein